MKAFSIAIANVFAGLVLMLVPMAAFAEGLTPDSYHWYAPEHEKYGRTAFYIQPAFNSGMVRVTRTQRFKLVGARKGWALIEFDVAGKAYVHLRVLRNLVYDPAASDHWYEFQRASVFPEEPAKIEARLKAPVAPTPTVTDSKTPSWKRYKDAWGLKPGRAPSAPAVGSEEQVSDTAQTTSRPLPGSPGAKPRNKYPLLPPIGSAPPQETTQPENSDRDRDTDAATPR